MGAVCSDLVGILADDLQSAAHGAEVHGCELAEQLAEGSAGGAGVAIGGVFEVARGAGGIRFLYYCIFGGPRRTTGPSAEGQSLDVLSPRVIFIIGPEGSNKIRLHDLFCSGKSYAVKG